MKKLYLFDFDGTLTHKDTMFLFLKFYNRRKYWKQFLRHIPIFVLLKMNLVDAESAKKSFISSILKGEKKAKIEKKANEFFEQFYPNLIRKNALDFIKNIDRKNTESLLVTASLDIWVRPFAEKFQMQLLATEAEFVEEIFTGKFITPNCNGEEKVRRVKDFINEKNYDKTIAYGDTSGDLPMLSWVNEGHYKFFH